MARRAYQSATPRGPAGDWSDRRRFLDQIDHAAADLRREQVLVTKRSVATLCGRSERTLARALLWYGVPSWPFPPV